jgi:hypothetical protein
MDVSKLKNVIADLVNENEEADIQQMNNLVSLISSNQSVEIISSIKKINNSFDLSIVNTYSPSNIKILTEIGGLDYFGENAKQIINKILNGNSYNLQKVISDLQNYLNKRTEFLATLKLTDENLKKLNIENHYHDDYTFEIGILMPSEFTHKKINKITKELNHWDKVFKTLKELVGEPVEDTEINFVSNGSLQFFIDNSKEISSCLALTIVGIVKLYKDIVEIRLAKEKLKKLGVSSGEQKTIEKQEKDYFTKQIDKISLDIIKDFANKNIEPGRLNEIKIAMKGHVTYIARCIDNGLTIEIIPPELSEPTIPKEDESNKSQVKEIKDNYDDALKKIEIVQKSMETMKTIGQTGMDIMKFLTHKDDEEDVNEEEENEDK